MKRTEPIRDARKLKEFLSYYKKQGEYRNHVLVNLGVFTALRISDILKLNTNDVYDFKRRTVKETITIKEKKTGKYKQIALHPKAIKALGVYFSIATPNSPLIMNSTTFASITRQHAYRIIDEAAKAVSIPHRVSCHSLRKTFGYHSWQNGTSPVILMAIYNHSSYEVTKRYLGVEQDDQNKAYRSLLF